LRLVVAFGSAERLWFIDVLRDFSRLNMAVKFRALGVCLGLSLVFPWSTFSLVARLNSFVLFWSVRADNALGIGHGSIGFRLTIFVFCEIKI